MSMVLSLLIFHSYTTTDSIMNNTHVFNSCVLMQYIKNAKSFKRVSSSASQDTYRLSKRAKPSTPRRIQMTVDGKAVRLIESKDRRNVYVQVHIPTHPFSDYYIAGISYVFEVHIKLITYSWNNFN